MRGRMAVAPEDGDGEPQAGPEAAPGIAPEARVEAVVQAGRKARKSLRDIAVDLFGAERVAAEWLPGGSMRARVRRLVQRDPGPGRKACE